ncbi:MAG: hypothetical protein ABI322_06070 [Gemmatimonadaceae bacterium]
MAFAVYWNNSDDQFFFQLALPLAVTAAVSMRTRMRPALVGFLGLFGWNAYATVWHYVTYPRQRNVEILAHESNTTALLIFPGEDDISSLLAFVPKPSGQERIAITGLAEQLPARDGLAVLRDSVNAVVQRGGIVTAISVIDAPVDQNPWKYLRSLGYEHSMVTSTLTSVAILCQARTVGPWSSRLAVRKSPPSRAPCPKESASQ